MPDLKEHCLSSGIHPFKRNELRSESEIIGTWDKYDSPVISILCPAFNHAKYIEDAICGFLAQTTTVPIEILINDDASTDGTAKIAVEIAQRYPNIIKVIAHRENQYSKGKKAILDFLFPACRGEYVAICEADDYWTDPAKLSRQLAALRLADSVKMAFHSATTVDQVTKKCLPFSEETADDRHVTFDQIVEQGGSFIPTASLMLHRSVFHNIDRLSLGSAPALDYFLQILGASRKGAICLAGRMSVYRANVPGSWSDRVFHDSERLRAHRIAMHKKFLEVAPTLGVSREIIRKKKFDHHRRLALSFFGDRMIGAALKQLLLLLKSNPFSTWVSVARSLLGKLTR